MYKISLRSQTALSGAKFIKNLRFFSAVPPANRPLFPNKDEFPSRHIGPRDSDIITMLDTLGFKVIFLKYFFFMVHFFPLFFDEIV